MAATWGLKGVEHGNSAGIPRHLLEGRGFERANTVERLFVAFSGTEMTIRPRLGRSGLTAAALRMLLLLLRSDTPSIFALQICTY